MKLAVKGLVAKQTAGGVRFYWEPSPAERKAKWKGLALGQDLAAAVKAADARNAEVEEWKQGGARPRAVSRYTAPRTFGAIIRRYRAEHLPNLGATTQKVNKVALDRLEHWAGDKPVTFITRQRVRVLRDGMLQTIGHYPAFKTLKMGRELCAWARRMELIADNPFLEFGLAEPPPRQDMWEPEDIALAERAAADLDLCGIGFAVALAAEIGQREGDLLRLGEAQWRELRGLDRADYDRLAAPDGPDAGKAMGVYVRQGKTSRWVGVPVTGDTRRRIEATIAANAERRKKEGAVAVTALVLNSRTNLPYSQRHFIRDFAAVRDRAIALASDSEQVDRLGRLQFRDLRRTCVVRLGELGLEDQMISAITGHKLETIKKILEIYMPRTTKMAARAIVARLADAREAAPAKKETA
jgi:hypothetical protein